MSTKVKRGLGLLAVALVAMLIGLAATGNDAPAATTQLLGLVALASGAAGLVLLAWGLLRD